MKKILIIVSLLFAVNTAAAENLLRGRAKFGPRGESVPYIEMHTLSAQSEKELINKTSVWMRNFTRTSGYEACANICHSPTTNMFAHVLATSNSQIGCAVSNNRCPSGFVPLGRTIHSHPNHGDALVMNNADREFLRARSPGQHIRRRHRMSAQANQFSEIDYIGGAGYLVTMQNVWYQEGRGTEKKIE